MIAPVLGRPHNAEPLAESLIASTDRARLVFVCSPADTKQIAACRALSARLPAVETMVVPWDPGRADWARKLEYARAATEEPYMLLGADDIQFHPGWAEAVLEVYEVYDVGVVGTNDLANSHVMRGDHSTHPVVCRGYVALHGTIDEPGRMVHDGYWHSYVDNELVETARSRNCWAFAPAARVEHRHPIWRTAPNDPTYDRGQKGYSEDRALYTRRQKLWRHPRAVA